MTDKPRSAPWRLKRYGGRRLYDPACARYVSADDVRRAFLDSVVVEVRDSGSGMDVTAEVLSGMTTQ